MTQEEVVLVIPQAPPPSLNVQERMHWAKRRALRREWEKWAWVAWLEVRQPVFRHPQIDICLYYPHRRKRDLDNAFAAAKPILDGLKSHAFADDDIEHIKLSLAIHVDTKFPRVEIHMREQEN